MTPEEKRRLGWCGIAAVLVIVVVVGCVMMFWGRPPQMGADEEVFNTVDALFTAVTAKDPRLVEQCEQRLNGYREANKLPAGAAAYLDGVITQTKNGQWESAAHRLYDFMTVQRREGRHAHRPGKNPHRHDHTKKVH